MSYHQAESLHGCPLISLKDLNKEEKGSADYHVDKNSGIVFVKWFDNSIVHLVSNYISVEPIARIDRWCHKGKVVKAVPYPKIVSTYNKSMGSEGLPGMLITLYWIDEKARRWYIKEFWHFVDKAN